MNENRPRRGVRLWAPVLGIAVLGFVGGVLAAIVANDVIAGIWPQALMVIAPLSLPIGALAGAGLAGLIAYRRLSRKSEIRPPE